MCPTSPNILVLAIFSEKSPRKFAAFGPSALAFDKSGSFVALVMQSRLII